MKLDERFMTIMTALVLMVGVGAIFSRGENGETILGGPKVFAPSPDTFTLRAGRVQSLDVLLNDANADIVDASQLRVVTGASCGQADSVAGAIQYSDSATCTGTVQLSYCVPFQDSCEPTDVSLTVLNVEKEQLEAIAAARTESEGRAARSRDGEPAIMTDVVQATAPQETSQIAIKRPVRLEIPSSSEVITPAESVASIRNRDVDSSVTVEVSELNDSAVNVPQTSARSGRVATGAVTMAAPDAGTDSSSVSIGGKAVASGAPARSAAPVGFGVAPTDFQPFPQVADAPLPRSEPPMVVAAAEPSVAPIPNSTEPSSAAISQAPDVLPATPAAPESSGMLASIARSSSFLGVTVSAAKALLAPDEGQQAGAISVANTRSAPRPRDFAITDGFAGTAVPGDDVARAIPLPQIERPVAAPIPAAPELLAALQPQDSLSSVTTAARPAAPIIAAPPVQEAEEQVEAEQLASLSPEVPVTIEEPSVAPLLSENCSVDMSLQLYVGAEIVASVVAPCHPERSFEVDHAGLRFSARTDADGIANFVVPAMVRDATVSVRFDDETTVQDQVVVDNMDNLVRVAVMWSAEIDFDLHANEFGASDTSDGHIWAGNPSDYRLSRRSGGGYLTVLGPTDGSGLKAEVYSIFKTSRTQDGLVDLTLKLAAFGQSCDMSPLIQTLRTEGPRIERDRDIQFALSSCDSASQVAIPNTIRDIRLSSR